MSVQARPYAVSDFADDYLGSEPGVNLTWAGSATAEVGAATQSELYASPLIATVLWRAFIEGDGFEQLREEFPDAPAVDAVRDMFIVRHPIDADEPRHDLMLLVAADVERRGVRFQPDPQVLEAGWERMRGELEEESAHGAPALAVFARSPQALLEAANVQPLGVLIARAPEMISNSVPSPAIDVRCPASPEEFSSVGLLVEEVEGNAVGVTVALHALETAGCAAEGAAVSIGGRDGLVRSTDAITDSAFVALDDLDGIATTQVVGVLSGASPRISRTPSRFEGLGSGSQSTHITGWSPEIPVITRRMQLRVTTDPDTVPGDSGAALIDGDENVLGFAFERTGYNEFPPFASWIWADSVMRAHNLRLRVRR
jgi:hypothetical protein